MKELILKHYYITQKSLYKFCYSQQIYNKDFIMQRLKRIIPI